MTLICKSWEWDDLTIQLQQTIPLFSSCSPLVPLGSAVVFNGQSQFPAVNGVANPKPELQILVCQDQQYLKGQEPSPAKLTLEYKHFLLKKPKQLKRHLKRTLPLLMFSEQLRMYMGIPMTTSSQAWTAPALHCDMQVFRVSSACWSRSSCSSPSDRLCCVGLSESAMVRLWCGIQEGYRGQKDKICHADNK